MRGYKIESYVPEEGFFRGKDAHFWRAAFEDCFVIDLHYGVNVIASCRGTNKIDVSMAEAATLFDLFAGEKKFYILPSSAGTLLIYPTWPRLELALAFLVKEKPEEVEKAYENAQRYAFSTLFNATSEAENNQRLSLEDKLCTLRSYMDFLFGAKRQTNVMAHVLMIANLVGCRVHEASVSRVNVTLEERETERLCAYLFCAFMTMRRYNGKVSALPENSNSDANLHDVPQEYGLRIEQSIRERIASPSAFDLSAAADMAPFVRHPLFCDYKINESNGAICLHIPLKQKATLYSLNVRNAQKEITFVLFPLF